MALGRAAITEIHHKEFVMERYFGSYAKISLGAMASNLYCNVIQSMWGDYIYWGIVFFFIYVEMTDTLQQNTFKKV